MIITEVYKKYRINKGLQEHMIRVASVAKMICDNYAQSFESDNLIKACLLHDMGNIVKTKFDLFPELFEPEGAEFYKQVQKEMVEKYGTDDHEVTLAMLLELQISPEVISILSATGLRKIPDVVQGGSTQEKIMMYSDLRVGMRGIITLDERFDDLSMRYVPHRYTSEIIEMGREQMKEIELEIFKYMQITPEDIIDDTVISIQEQLWGWSIN